MLSREKDCLIGTCVSESAYIIYPKNTWSSPLNVSFQWAVLYQAHYTQSDQIKKLNRL